MPSARTRPLKSTHGLTSVGHPARIHSPTGGATAVKAMFIFVLDILKLLKEKKKIFEKLSKLNCLKSTAVTFHIVVPSLSCTGNTKVL